MYDFMAPIQPAMSGSDRALLCEKAIKGDPHGTVERLDRCVEVYERFPGLFRFTLG